MELKPLFLAFLKYFHSCLVYLPVISTFLQYKTIEVPLLHDKNT